MASSLLNSCDQGTVHAVAVLRTVFTSLSGLRIQMLSEYDLEYKDATTLIQKMGAVQFSQVQQWLLLLCPLPPQTSPTTIALWGLLPSQCVPAAYWNKIQLSSIYPDHQLLIAQCLRTLNKAWQKVKVLIDRPNQMRWHTNMSDALFLGKHASIDDFLLFFVALSCCIIRRNSSSWHQYS
jgi:hypothetical protein